MDLNSFFDNATPAQINQLTASPPKQEVQPQAQENQQQHPHIAMAQLDELPQVEFSPAESDVQASPEQVEPQVPLPQEEPKETPQQMRFREMRESKLRAEWERDDYRRRLQELEQERIQPAQKQAEEKEDYGIDPDAIIEGKDVDKIVRAVEKRVERKYQAQQQSMMQNVVENRLRMEMPDIASVLSDQNVMKLNQMYPELAASLAANPDQYTKAKAAYQLMKRLNIVEEAAPQPSYDYEADRRRIAQNSAKPRPVQTVAQRQSPLAASNSYDGELTQSIKDTYWKEMQKAMKG